MALNIFVIGYYGSHNLGDELILESTISLIREAHPDANIRALTYSIKETEGRHGVVGVSRNDFSAILSALNWCDWLVGGGGSMLQNVTSNRSLIYYLFLLKVGKLLKKRIVLLGNGVGPIRHSFYRGLTDGVLKHVSRIVLRDPESYAYLKGRGMSNIALGADLAFNLKAEPQRHQGQSKRLILNLRPWQNALAPQEWVPQFIDHWQRLGYTIQLLPMQSTKDDVLLKAFQSESVPCLEPHTAGELLAALSEADLVIGMRLHTLILSAIAGTPFVAIGYDPKVMSFVKESGQILACETAHMSLERIQSAVQEALSRLPELEERLSDYQETLKERKAQNGEALK